MKLIWMKTLVVAVVLGASWAFYSFGTQEVTFEVPGAVSFEEVKERALAVTESVNLADVEVTEEEVVASEPESEPEPIVEEEIVTSELPAEVNLAVPFTPQAPFANWDEVHEDTCEEASLLMVHAFYEGQARGLVDPNVADDVLLDMVESENLIFGYFKDTTAQETAEFAKIYYGYERVEVLENPSVNDLKSHLAEGRPVLVPAAGRILANPFFSGIGPIYHMIVLKGYTQHGFITNDPGTRRGADWVYSYDHLMSAMHDWVVPEGIEDRADTIPDSARKAIVIYPN